MEESDTYVRPGPKTLEERRGEKITDFKMKIPRSQHDFITKQNMSAAAFMRRLIDMSMWFQYSYNYEPEKWLEVDQEILHNMIAFGLLDGDVKQIRRRIIDVVNG